MKRSACSFLMVLTLAACGTPTNTNTGAAPTPVPAGTPITAGSPEDEALQALATQIGAAANTLQLTGIEAQDWNDSSLGCAGDGMYTQVITPGFKYTFSDGTKTYAVHSDTTGSSMVLCENGKPTTLGTVTN